MRHYLSRAAGALVFVALQAAPAAAVDKIYSPNLTEGEWELEYFGARTFDPQPARDNLQTHEFSVGYGATSWWWPEFYAILQGGGPNGATRLTGVQLENRFQFFEPGEYWVDPGLLVAYTHAPLKGSPDALEVKLLLEKQWGRTLHRANIGFEEEVGRYAQGGPDRVFLWSSRYRYRPYFEPGFEIQSDFGKANEVHSVSQQQHFVGPAAYGELLPHLKYEAAYLFGVTHAAAKGAGRFLLEYELFF